MNPEIEEIVANISLQVPISITGKNRILILIQLLRNQYPDRLSEISTYLRNKALTDPPENAHELIRDATAASQDLIQYTTFQQELKRAYHEHCGFCNLEPNFRCTKCKLMCYCSKECQLKHWKTHKKLCK